MTLKTAVERFPKNDTLKLRLSEFYVFTEQYKDAFSVLENLLQSVQVWQTFICDFFNKLKPCHQHSQIVDAIPIAYRL